MNLPVPVNPALPQLAPVGPPPLGLAVTAEQRLELLEYWRSITKRKWMVLGLTIVVAIVAAMVAMALTPVYRSTALVLIEASKGKILSIEDVYSSNNQREHYQTQVEVIKSREVAERTVRALKLWEHPLFDARQAQPGLRERALAMVGVAQDKTALTEDELIAYATRKLQQELNVDAVRLSQLVKVSIDSPDAKLAAQIANTLATEYIDADRDARFRITQNISGFLQDRLASLRENLSKSEKALQDYRETKGIVSLSGSAQTMAGQQVGGTAERLLTARSRRLELESKYQQVKAVTNGDYSGVPWVSGDPAVANALRDYNDTNRKVAEALQTLGQAHPRARQLVADRDLSLATLRRLTDDAAKGVVREYEAARNTEQALERALNQARGAVQTINRGEFELQVLERDVQTNRQLYDMFMSRAKETNITGDVQASVARIVDAAVPVYLAVKPKRTQIVLVAALLALLLGALASVLIDRLDNTVKGGEDAEHRLKQPLLAALPQVEGMEPARVARLYLDDAHSHFAEAIRTARTGVLLSSLDSPHKVLLITSSLPGEGKTTVAVNLALAHAQTKRTLLIDCDMRRSQVSRALNIAPGTLGLSNLVAGSAQLEQCLHGVPDSPLTVLPVGDLPPNPLELMLSQRFKDTLKSLSEEFEMVIIDSPPVELVSEALVLAPMATSTAFVVKAMSTPAPLVRKNLTRLQRAGANILGVVVNQLDFKHARLYYGEYGAASYNYGYGENAKLTYGARATKTGGAAKAHTPSQPDLSL